MAVDKTTGQNYTLFDVAAMVQQHGDFPKLSPDQLSEVLELAEANASATLIARLGMSQGEAGGLFGALSPIGGRIGVRVVIIGKTAGVYEAAGSIVVNVDDTLTIDQILDAAQAAYEILHANDSMDNPSNPAEYGEPELGAIYSYPLQGAHEL